MSHSVPSPLTFIYLLCTPSPPQDTGKERHTLSNQRYYDVTFYAPLPCTFCMLRYVMIILYSTLLHVANLIPYLFCIQDGRLHFFYYLCIYLFDFFSFLSLFLLPILLPICKIMHLFIQGTRTLFTVCANSRNIGRNTGLCRAIWSRFELN